MKISRERELLKKKTHSVITPVGYKPDVPVSCPVCDFLLRNIDDEISYNKFNCCAQCANEWAYPNQEKWKLGWRPELNNVKERILKRDQITLNVKE